MLVNHNLNMTSDLVEGLVSSTKASISVILVLVYGYLLRKFGFLSQDGESNISRLGTKFLLPALLFTEIGPLATASNLKNYWPIIPLSLFYQCVALMVALISRLAGMPQHYVPMFIFNNVTSLPLLLISALAATGGLDPLVTDDRTLDSVVKAGRVYILINALVGNLTRFAMGPYLMKANAPQSSKAWFRSYHDHVEDDSLLSDSNQETGHIALLDEEDREPPSIKHRTLSSLNRAKEWIINAMNPPLTGGILAVAFGMIPWFHRELFGPGVLSPLSDSLNNVGKLFSALQMLVLGSHLFSKKGSKTQPFFLAWLFTYRFIIAPALSISVVYFIRTTWPNLLDNDPMLDYVLALSNVGPPALTLAAVAVMADLPSEVEGQVSRILTFSYAIQQVTPFISFPVTITLWMIKQTGVGN
ncbi:membrane transport protein-domain-containing protein [Mycena belliarum]|uniref:Membrane transport protein-domain-containing protein n=1 Tax=Mycena belliarum TaxID=1033014 RepID=A0AAD6XQK7_9AGAR|nr:membrane transport protein-domain-containing protein [Mycena belliae]